MPSEPNLFCKIIHADPPFLVPRRLADIGRENFGTACERPLVLFADPQEALEKSLWFYAHNILPLMGEPNNLAVTAFTAKSYGIDAIVSEFPIAAEFIEKFSSEYDISRIKTLTLIGRRFTYAELESFMAGGRHVRALLALPDVGAFAESCTRRLSEGEVVFHPDATAELSLGDGGTIVVTKTIELLEPVAKHTTGIAAETVPNCPCGALLTFRLQ